MIHYCDNCNKPFNNEPNIIGNSKEPIVMCNICYSKEYLDNTINIKPVKESWNREEVAELLFKALTEGAKMNMFEGAFRPKDYFEKEFKEWIEDNL